MMLNHQKGPKQNWKKNSCSQFQAPVPQTNDQLGANAPTRLLGPPSNWPYDESFALAMRAAAAVRGMTWNDGVISWMCKQFGVWDRSTQLICTFFLRWALSRSFATAELRDRGGLPHVRAHGLGGRRATCSWWHLSSQKWSGTWAQSMLSFLHFHPGDREEKNVGYHGYTRTVLLKHLAFSCLHKMIRTWDLAQTKTL